MRVPPTARSLAAFAALTLLCGTSHEFAHHFAGAVVRGAFGTKTFDSFHLAPGCESSPASKTLAHGGDQTLCGA